MKNINKTKLIGIGIIMTLVIVSTTYFALRDNDKYVIKENIVHELGWFSIPESDDDSVVVFDTSDFITADSIDEYKVIVDYEDSDLVEHNDEVFLAVGTYKATASKLDDTRATEFEFEVKDTISPTLKDPEDTKLVFEDVDMTNEDLISQIKNLFDDFSKFDVEIAEDALKEITLDTPGTYSIETVVEDEHLNKSETEVVVQLIILEKGVVSSEDIEGKTFVEAGEVIVEKVEEAKNRVANAESEVENQEDSSNTSKNNSNNSSSNNSSNNSSSNSSNKPKEPQKAPEKKPSNPAPKPDPKPAPKPEKPKEPAPQPEKPKEPELQFVGIAAYAKKYIGRDGISCGQLINKGLIDMGYTMKYSITLSNGGTRGGSLDFEDYTYSVGLGSIKPGDILQSPGHVELYLGNNMSLHGGYTAKQSVAVAKTSEGVYDVYRYDGSITYQDVIDRETAFWEDRLASRDD